jgi:hypothetical protein
MFYAISDGRNSLVTNQKLNDKELWPRAFVKWLGTPARYSGAGGFKSQPRDGLSLVAPGKFRDIT